MRYIFRALIRNRNALRVFPEIPSLDAPPPLWSLSFFDRISVFINFVCAWESLTCVVVCLESLYANGRSVRAVCGCYLRPFAAAAFDAPPTTALHGTAR